MPKKIFKNKKVLLMGLGILGGGLNLANWLTGQGALLTITDLKNKGQLKKSISRLKNKNKIKFVLGRHREEDFLKNETIVFNQDIQLSNHYLKIAEKNGKQIEDELTLFARFSPTKNIIAITGTRGKTTTANWIAHFLKSRFKTAKALGNSPDNSLMANIEKLKKGAPAVLECPSCLLEQSFRAGFSPRVAVITNLYQDHLNRYEGKMKNYALAKAKIFLGQGKKDILILNYQNKWTKFFLKKNPFSQIFFFSKKRLPAGLRGIFAEKNKIVFREKGKEKIIADIREFQEKWGSHNLENLLPAILAALKSGISAENISRSLKSLPQIKFRQELIFKNSKLEIYNDTASTSPEAAISAVKKFSKNNNTGLNGETKFSGFRARREGDKIFKSAYCACQNNLILIAGGTDKQLDYSNWAKIVKKNLGKKDIIFLSGSATEKMKKELGWKKVNEFDSLKNCFKMALEKAKNKKGKTAVLFSPGAKSFEKFKNEFDRGEKFNDLVKKMVG